MLRSAAAVAAAPLFGHCVVALLGMFAGAALLFTFFFNDPPEDFACFLVWALLNATESVLVAGSLAYCSHFGVSPESKGPRADLQFLMCCLRLEWRRVRKNRRPSGLVLSPVRHAA